MKKEKLEEKKVDESPKKDNGAMKKQIISLVVGILLGSAITLCIFMAVKPKCENRVTNIPQFNRTTERNRKPFDFKQDRRNNDKSIEDETKDKQSEETKENNKS